MDGSRRAMTGARQTDTRETLTRRRGIALLAVLWSLTLFALVAASFAASTRGESRISRNVADQARARALADGGVHRAIFGLIERDPALQWVAGSTVHEIAVSGERIRVVVEDEAGKIDLNRAPDELLKGLFLSQEVEDAEATAIVDAIVDFRDQDDLRHVNGAEFAEYRDAGLSYGPKNKSFEAVEELGRVLGVSPEIYRRVAPFLTVYTRQRGIDPRVAPPEVLRAIPGLDPAQVEALSPNQEDEEEADNGDAPIGQPSLLGIDRRFVSRTRNRVFSIRSEGQTASGTIFVRDAVVGITGIVQQPYHVYAWRRGSAASRP